MVSSNSFTRGLLLAVAAIAVMDVGVRLLEPRLSGDIANTLDFPNRVADLSATPGKRVAAIGNSLIGEGLDTELFMASWLDRNPVTGRAIKLVPDASAIWDWHCIVRYQLASASPAPDVVIIGFGWNQLSDQSRLGLSRAFNTLCPAAAMQDFSRLSGRIGVNDWLEMAAVKTSKLYAHRQPIRHRVLQNIVPDYRRMTRQTNVRAGDTDSDDGVERQRHATYNALTTILEELSGAGAQVALVAMPVMNPYEIDKDICDVIAGTSHRFLDMRFAVPSSDELYRDNLHLNEAGARLFSETLATQLRAPRASMSPCMT